MCRAVAGSALLALATGLAPAPARAQSAKLLIPLPQLELAAQRDSTDPLAHYDVALGYWMAKRWDDAERALRRAVAIEPKTAAAWLALAYLPYARREKLWEEERKGKVPPELQAAVAESDRNYRRAFLIDPLVDLKIYGLMLPPWYTVANTKRQADAYAELTRGFVLFWDGRYDLAYDWFDRIVRLTGREKVLRDYPGFIWYHGIAAAHSGRYDAASADFHALVEKYAAAEKTDSIQHFTQLRANEYRYILATVLQSAGRQDSAIALYQEALANDLGLYAAHTQLANIHEENHDWDRAVVERQRALDTNPDDPSLALDLGSTLVYARRYQAALAPLEQAQAANPWNARIPYMLGMAQLRLGDAAAARPTLARFVAIAPSRFQEQVADVRQQLARLP
ncbi:MAG TPA: tetratricopeptide repeat protein [Gemmatimonadales bacterium]|nr:tetratricopeptide repeat protein [Gemmatimonadales bacterium]